MSKKLVKVEIVMEVDEYVQQLLPDNLCATIHREFSRISPQISVISYNPVGGVVSKLGSREFMKPYFNDKADVTERAKSRWADDGGPVVD